MYDAYKEQVVFLHSTNTDIATIQWIDQRTSSIIVEKLFPPSLVQERQSIKPESKSYDNTLSKDIHLCAIGKCGLFIIFDVVGYEIIAQRQLQSKDKNNLYTQLTTARLFTNQDVMLTAFSKQGTLNIISYTSKKGQISTTVFTNLHRNIILSLILKEISGEKGALLVATGGLDRKVSLLRVQVTEAEGSISISQIGQLNHKFPIRRIKISPLNYLLAICQNHQTI